MFLMANPGAKNGLDLASGNDMEVRYVLKQSVIDMYHELATS
jgi:hypothetical protein